MFLFKKITDQEQLDFIKNLSVLVRGGVPIDEALNSLVEQTREGSTFRKILQGVHRDVLGGTLLSEALAKEKKAFGDVTIGLLQAGEASGTLSENLSFLADWLEETKDLKKEIQAAMLYPKIILAGTILLGGALAIFILPRLVPLFIGLHVELPLATRVLLRLSLFVQDFWYIIALSFVALFFGIRLLGTIAVIRRLYHHLITVMPIISGYVKSYQLALVAQLFATLFKSGLSVNDSLTITAEATTNLRYRASLLDVKKRVLGGTHVSDALREYPSLYPSNVLHLIHAGEQSGTLDTSLSYIAEYYSKEVRTKTKILPTIIEPILLLIIGLSIGFIALSIILPIYQLTSGFGR